MWGRYNLTRSNDILKKSNKQFRPKREYHTFSHCGTLCHPQKKVPVGSRARHPSQRRAPSKRAVFKTNQWHSMKSSVDDWKFVHKTMCLFKEVAQSIKMNQYKKCRRINLNQLFWKLWALGEVKTAHLVKWFRQSPQTWLRCDGLWVWVCVCVHLLTTWEVGI